MLRFENLSFAFAEAESATLSRLNLEYQAGELALICGPTGSGKSTFLKVINGLAPHFTAGTISGNLLIDGEQFVGKLPHDFARVVGYVSQQAETSFVADRVDEEIAFGMEQLGFEPARIASEITKVAELLEIDGLLHENLSTLSGGQQQRVAIAAALAVGQKILLLDEPTSELDAKSAHELLLWLRKLADQEKLCILIAEHRIERALNLVDSITVIHGDATASYATKDNMQLLLQDYRLVPPLLELGKAKGWSPLPLSISEAKRLWSKSAKTKPSAEVKPKAKQILCAENLTVTYDSTQALDQVSLELCESEIVGVLGPNGSGKSSLLWALQGSQESVGTIEYGERVDPRTLSTSERLEHVTLVPQTAADLLMFNSVAEELHDSDSVADQPPGTTGAILSDLAGRLDPNRNPRDLSAGQQLALVLAIQLAKGAQVVLLDEPTRGLDYESKRKLVQQLIKLKLAGKAILLSSHDVEFLALVADRMIQLENGRIVKNDSTKNVLATLGELAPQIWQITEAALTVEEALQL